MNLPYKPQDIRNFFAYSYEFIAVSYTHLTLPTKA